MKYYFFIIVLCIITLWWCLRDSSNNEKISLLDYKNSNTKLLSDKNKIIDNLVSLGFSKDCKQWLSNIKDCFIENNWNIIIQKSGNTWNFIIPNTIKDMENIHHEIDFISWDVLYKNHRKIKIPEKMLWWSVNYNITNDEITNLSLYPEGFDIDLAPQWVNINIKHLWSWEVCNPYDLEHFNLAYYENLNKKWRFFIEKRAINNMETIVSHEKKYYSHDGTEELFNGWYAMHCFINNNKEYKISGLLMDRKKIDEIISSFEFIN